MWALFLRICSLVLHSTPSSIHPEFLFGKWDIKGSLNFLCQWQSSSLSLDSHFGDQLWHFVYLSWGSPSLIWGSSNSSRWNLGWKGSSHFKPLAMSRDIFTQIRFLRAPFNLLLSVSRDGACTSGLPVPLFCPTHCEKNPYFLSKYDPLLV